MTRKKEWSLKDKKHITADDHLLGEEKPTENQVAWVFAHLKKILESNSDYRKLIYDEMGFGPESYSVLMDAAKIIHAFQELKDATKN